MDSCRVSRRRLRVQPGATCLLHVAIFRRVTFLLHVVAFVRVADGLVDCHNLTNPSESSNLLSNSSFDTSCLDTGWRRKKLNASCDPWPYLFPWRALEPGETISTDEFLATAASGGAKLGPLLTSAGATLAEAIATAAGAASAADVSINNGVTGVTDTLLAADGSRFLRLTSAISASLSDDDASGSSNGSNSSSSGSAFGGPGVAQALCELKPAAAPTINVSQQAQQQQQQQQQSPRQLSLSFFARASLCAEGEEGAEGEAERLLKVLLLAVPLNASGPATAGGDGTTGGGGEGGAGEQVWAEWRVGVPCGGSRASLSGALPWFQVGPLLFPLPDPPDSSSSSSASSPSSLVVPPGGVALHLVIRGLQDSNSSSNSTSGTATVATTSSISSATSSIAASSSDSSSIGTTSATVAASTGGAAGAGVGVKAAVVKRVGVVAEVGGGAGAGSTDIDLASVMPTRTNPSPLKCFSHWPLSRAHPLLTAGSARRNSSSLALTTLSDLNSAALALHPAPFALLAPATPASPCRPFSFSTSFAFRISSPNAAGLGGEGLAFVMLPTPTLGLPGPSLGYGRVPLPPGSTTGADHSSDVSSQQRSLAVEFDTSSSPEFFDRPDHHVGVNLHGSMLSLASAPVHPLGIPALNAGQPLLATIRYNASSSQLTVWLSPVPRSSSRSASSFFAPPLPRSAVLTTFLDTCEWLGGNDPQAAAPPPPLFVGFTAATGKGAEQAQAHEVLGWSFEVGEAEDSLPFWAADSFSFPYITPATPLQTRGSTRKRFFAADLSVAAADVTFTGQSDDPTPGALFFPRRLPLLYSSSSPPFPPPPRRPRSSPHSSPSSSPPQPTATEPPICMARSFTFTYGFSINVSASQGLAFVISTHASVGLGGAYMGYGRDPSSRLANGSWPDGARSVAVEWHPETDNVNVIHLNVNTDFNMTSIFSEKLLTGVEPEDVLQMRVDYNGRSKEMLIRWYQPPLLVDSMNVSLDLCAALTGPSATSGSSSGGGSGSSSRSRSSTTTTTTATSGSSSSSSDSSVTDLASPSFGHLFVGLTSAALPPPPGRLPSPVTIYSWTFRFTDTDPCKGSPVLPCGMGACTKARAPWDPSILVPSCKCPFNLPSFQPSHLAGLPSCFPDSFTCRQLSTNPCAPGVCIDDIDGTFSCLCPSPYFPFYFYPKGTARCYHLRLAATRMPTFLSPFGLTCALILNTYGLTQADFFSQNKGFQCRVPIPVDTLVNVTSRAFSQCTSMYTANYGDTCDSLNALFSTQVQPLNPALTCSDGPRPGQLLCVDFNQTWLEEGKTRISCKLQAQITPAVTQTAPTPSPSPQPPPPPPLANYTSLGVPVTVLQGPQSCQQLWQAFAIDSPTRFFQMNPGLSCDALLPYSPMRGNMMSKICVASVDSRPFSGNTCSTNRLYSVKRGDTCGMLIAKKYRRKIDMFRELNKGYDCTVNRLWVGMLLCLP